VYDRDEAGFPSFTYLLKKSGEVGAVSQPRVAARFGNRGYGITFPRILRRYYLG
jgi:hypothetical protein